MHLTRPLAAALIGSTCALLAPGAAAQNLTTELVAGGFARPVHLTAPVGDFDRVFVCEQHTGRVEIIDLNTNTVLVTPFLDLTVATGNEQGLLGLAFHPDYLNNGRFFVSYNNTGGTTILQEYAVSLADPNVADAAPVATIFSVPQPFSNHNGGCIHFGSDGMLYLGLGDGGSANDPGNRAQNLGNALGKMLRFDVDIAAPYIPASNPFVGVAGALGEIWAYGLRNPWRFSFDRATGDLYIGDVGQNAWEEIDVVSGTSTGGENYGWRCMEGDACTGLSGCTCNAASLTDPVHDYSHSGGHCSVTGGFVYRGSNLPSLQGTYFFADYCSGRIWTFEWDANTNTIGAVIDRTTQLDPPNGTLSLITSFGEDAAGELYILTQGGQVWRVAQDCGTSTYCVGAPNSFSSGGAQMNSFGSTSISANAWNLSVTGATPNQFGMFFYGSGQTQVPAGDGFLCIDSSAIGLFRLLPPLPTDGLGSAFQPVNFAGAPMNMGAGTVLPGTTYNFQFWYRDPTGPGGTTYNFSNAVEAVFCP